MNGNGKFHIGVKMFIPNGILESFGWTCEVSMVNLGLTEAIKNIQIAISDQERALCDPSDNLSHAEFP